MSRDDRIAMRLAGVAFLSLMGLILVGEVYLWLYPPSDIEKACISKPPAEVRQCLWKFSHERR